MKKRDKTLFLDEDIIASRKSRNREPATCLMNLNQTVYLVSLMVLLICIATTVASSQSICVPKRIQALHVQGQVFFGLEGSRRPQQDVTVVLSDYRNYRKQKRVIATIITDSEGKFRIDHIKPGKYWLTTKHDQIIGIDVELSIVKKSHEDNHKNTQLVFVLGADPSQMCGGGYVELGNIPPG